MPWKKASRELIDILEIAMGEYPCERRMMFGSPTFIINNNMFAGVHQGTIIIRLSAKDRSEIMESYDEITPFEPMAGRIMKEYVTMPESVAGDRALFNEWLNRSYQFASSLPLKERKRKTKRKK